MNIEAFYNISYGLYAICSGNKKHKNGYIANTAFQVTAQPAQLAISCSKNNYTTKIIEESGLFSISILDQKAKSDLIGVFGYQSGENIDKFKSVDFEYGQTGVPILIEDCLAWFECKVVQKVDVGSHILFIGELVSNALLKENGTPLTYAYYRNIKKGLAPKNAPTYIEKAEEPKEEDTATIGETHHCLACGWEYDPEKGDPSQGIPPGTAFEDLPKDYHCPICGAGLDMFD